MVSKIKVLLCGDLEDIFDPENQNEYSINQISTIMKTIITLLFLMLATAMNAQTNSSCWESNDYLTISPASKVTNYKGYCCFCFNTTALSFYIPLEGIGLKTVIIDEIRYPSEDDQSYSIWGKIDDTDVSIWWRIKQDIQILFLNGKTWVIDKIKYVNQTPGVLAK